MVYLPICLGLEHGLWRLVNGPVLLVHFSFLLFLFLFFVTAMLYGFAHRCGIAFCGMNGCLCGNHRDEAVIDGARVFGAVHAYLHAHLLE